MSSSLELASPHGFLVWKGKQTAIASDEVIEESGKMLITSDDEAFGYATLAEAATLGVSEFDKGEWFNQHCIRPNERRLYWPQAKKLYVYRIDEFEAFDKPKIYLDNKIMDMPKLSRKQHDILQKSKLLPKQVLLTPNVISLTEDNKAIVDGSIDVDGELQDILNAVFETEVEITNEGGESVIPVYSLSLVRNPRLRVVSEIKKNELSKQEGNSMPWKVEKRDDEYCVVKVDGGDVEGCHGTESDAEAQLTALNIAESKSVGQKRESISAMISRVHQQFQDEFKIETEEGWFDWPWVRDIFDTHLIVDDDGVLYRVNYIDDSEKVMFTPREGWVEVEINYTDKAAKLLKSFKKEKDKNLTPDWKAQLKAAAKTIVDYVTLKDIAPKEEVVDTPLDFSKPYGIAVKTVNGEPWHFTWSTNAFEDRDGEIFSTKSLEQYVAQNEKNEIKGYYNFWHINEEDGNFNTDYAEKRWQGVVGGFLVEAGPYLDNHQGRSAKAFYSEFPNGHPDIAPEGWGCSPEYKFLPEERKTGVYENIWITRTSTLPRLEAANIWTEAKQEGVSMALTESQKQAAIAKFGEEWVENLLAEGDKRTEELESAGVAHKAKEGTDSESKDQGQETDSNSPELTFDMEELAKALAGQFDVNIKPVADTVEVLAESIKAIGEKVAKLEEKRELQLATESPRYTVSIKRAIEAEETALSDDDDLKEKKPTETKPSDASSTGADHFFKKK